MSDYTQTTFFTPKDSLPTGNAAKVVKGSEFDTEFSGISTAVATKYDTAGEGLASTGSTVSLDLGELTAATIAVGDFVPFEDISDSSSNKSSTLANVVDVIATGADTGVDHTSGVLEVDIAAVTAEATVDGAVDQFLMYDDSATANRKTDAESVVLGGVAAVAGVTTVDVEDDDYFPIVVDGALKQLPKHENGYSSRTVVGNFSVAAEDGDGIVIHDAGGASLGGPPTSGVTVGWRSRIVNMDDTSSVLFGPGASVTLSSAIRTGVGALGNHTINAGGSAELIYLATDHWHIHGDIS